MSCPEIENLPWGEPKSVLVSGDPKLVKSAEPNDTFWNLWRSQKHCLKMAGISVGKWGGKFVVSWWEPFKLPSFDDVPIVAEIELPPVEPLQFPHGLLDYQPPFVATIVRAMGEFNASLNGCGTGIGKTFITLGAIRERGRRALVICPKVITEDWERAARSMGVPLAGVYGWEWMKTGKTPFLKWNTRQVKKKMKDGSYVLVNKKDHLFWEVPNDVDVVFDECLVAGSIVQTDCGDIAIEHVKPGMTAWTKSGYKLIRRTIKTVSKKAILKLRFNGGEIKCTPNHLLLTRRGWIKAKDIDIMDQLLYAPAYDNVLYKMRNLRQLSQYPKSKNKILLEEMPAQADFLERETICSFGKNEKAVFGRHSSTESCAEANDGEESHDESSNSRESQRCPKGTQASNQGREWVGVNHPPNSPSSTTWSEMDSRVHRVSENRLQGLAYNDRGLSITGIEISRGLRREVSQLIKPTREGSPKAGAFTANRLEDSPIQERHDIIQYARSVEDHQWRNVLSLTRDVDASCVYDLEVDDEHSFFANGVLVHNCHRAANEGTQNQKMVITAVEARLPIFGLSATIADVPTKLRAMGYALGIHRNGKDWYDWLIQHGVVQTRFGMQFQGGERHLKAIHKQIFPHKGIRVRAEQIKNFPKNQTIAKAYKLDEANKINSVYADMMARVAELECSDMAGGDKQACILVEILRARQAVELLKIPLMVSLTEDAIEEGNSVFLAVNFRDTLKELIARLGIKSIIMGGQKPEIRRSMIDEFQANKTNMIAGIIKACREGLNLHDIHGGHPRVALIMPTPSSFDLKQTLGRVWRAGGLTTSLQRILFADGTIEEDVCESLANKLDQLDLLMDGDLQKGIFPPSYSAYRPQIEVEAEELESNPF